jgi:TRAP-type C4-dicarboxylate transport system permease small subunit
MISWAGDYAWGPRYLTFALGILLLPAGFLFQDWLENTHSLRRWLGVAAVSVVFLAGAFVTYLGNAIYWDHFIRIETEATQAWLGLPNNKGDGISAPNAPCPVCFETIYSLQWLPPFQHILGNYWLLKHVPYNDSWVVAEKDAPWRRYTNLQLNIQQNYGRARTDWWFVDYRHTFPILAWSLVISLPALSALMLLLFLLEIRRAVRSLTQPSAGADLSAST